MNKLTLSALVLMMTLGLAACSQEDNKGPDVERAAENAGDIMEDAGDSMGESMEEAGEATQDAMDDMGDENTY